MTTPFVHGHDLCVLAIARLNFLCRMSGIATATRRLADAIAFLVRDSLEQGFLPGDRLIMLFCWIVLFLGFRDFTSGWIACLAVLAVVVRRAQTVAESNLVSSGSLPAIAVTGNFCETKPLAVD